MYITGTGTFSDGEWRITISEIIKQNLQIYKFKYDWTKVEMPNSELVTPEFLNKVVEISNELQIDPDDLMAVMAFESRFNPQEKNSTGAVGLIQFTGIAVKYINHTYGTKYTKDQIEKMNSLEQLDLVYLFYKEKTGNMYDVGDVYLVTLAPEFVDGIEKGNDVILYSKYDPKHPEYYESNKMLDKENKGYITKGDACAAVLDRRKEYEY